jgi:hypothetical protein
MNKNDFSVEPPAPDASDQVTPERSGDHMTNLRALEEMEAYIAASAPGQRLTLDGYAAHLASVNIA